MPKIIENLRARLIEEAERQVRESGYRAMTVRSVAKACGVGTGTVYNYFPSKDALLAGGMLEEWNRRLETIRAAGAAAREPAPVLRCVYDQLRGYAEDHKYLFRDTDAAAGFAGSFRRYHSLLRAQLAEPLRRFCDGDFAPEFIAEALLTWTAAGKEYEEIHGLLRKLF